MAAAVYPATLPGPSVSAVAPAERRLLSDLTGGPQQARGLQRDYLATQHVEWAVLSVSEAAAFDDWWKNTLTYGGAWFASTWPAPQGWISIGRRFIGAPQWTHLPGGFWKVSAQVQVRGRGAMPTRQSIGTVNGTAAPAGGDGIVLITPPARAAAGDAIVLITLHNGSALSVGAWGPTMVNTTDSSGAMRIQAFGRVMTGTSDDIVALAGVGSADTVWEMLTVANMQAGELTQSDSIGFGSGLKPPAIHKTSGGTGTMIVIAVGVVDAPASGGASFTAFPSGYSPFKAPDGSDRAEVNFSFTNDSLYYGRLACLYKIVKSGDEDPAPFTDGTGAYMSGGNGCVAIGLWYTP